MNISEERLEQIFNNLVEADCICEMSAVLTTLADAELEAVYEDCLEQYGQELALGALERSEWVCGTLIVNANQPSICFSQTALDAVRNEIEQREAALAGTRSAPVGLPN